MQPAETKSKVRSMRVFALLAAFVMLAAACGSRAEEGDGSGGLAGPTEPTTTAGDGSPPGDTFGGEPAPCGTGDGSAHEASDIGLTADSISVGVITDRKSSFVPGLNEGLWHGMEAFAEWCNALGGISGRTVELIEYDADIFSYRDRILEACDEVFALVGGGGIQDNLGAQEAVDCGLAEVAGVTVNAKKSGAERVKEPLPNPAGTYPAGPGQQYLEAFPEIAEHGAYLYTDIPIGSYQRDRHVQAYEQLGYNFTYTRGTEINESNWQTIVLELERRGIEYLSITSSPEETRNLLKAMADARWRPTVMDLEANYYDQKLLDAAGADADGIFVRVAMWPFEEADANPATAQLVKLLRDEAGASPSLLAMHSFSAGLLFATAASSVEGDLTRDGLLDAVGEINEWTGLGLHAPADPGTPEPSNCFIILRVTDGAYQRWYPELGSDDDNGNGYACDPEARIELDLSTVTNYEPGATAE